MSQKPRQSFPNIVVKSVDEERLGRFVLLINEMEKVVYITPVDGRAPSKVERFNIEKFLRYKRPDIVNPAVSTGWGIQSTFDLPL